MLCTYLQWGLVHCRVLRKLFWLDCWPKKFWVTINDHKYYQLHANKSQPVLIQIHYFSCKCLVKNLLVSTIPNIIDEIEKPTMNFEVLLWSRYCRPMYSNHNGIIRPQWSDRVPCQFYCFHYRHNMGKHFIHLHWFNPVMLLRKQIPVIIQLDPLCLWVVVGKCEVKKVWLFLPPSVNVNCQSIMR